MIDPMVRRDVITLSLSLRNQQIEQSVTWQKRVKWLNFHGLGGVNIQQKKAESNKKPPVISHFAMARHISQ